jgi:hypothetical protein
VSESARKGKIASLPAQIREEVNQRLYNGEQAPQILPWLNAHPDVLRVLDERWGEQPVSPQNLSEWRNGGYRDWLKRNDRVHALRTLSDYSLKLAQAAGGSISEGAAAIAGGRILELLERSAESLDDESDVSDARIDPDELVKSLVALRRTEIMQKKVDQNTIVLGQRDRQLALEEQRFQYRTVEKFFDFYEDQRAKEILESDAPRPVQMDQMVQLMFGAKPG